MAKRAVRPTAPILLGLGDMPSPTWTFGLSRPGIFWTIIVILLLCLGALKSINLLLLLGYLMAAVLVLNFFAAGRPLRGLKGRRRIAEPATAGVPCVVDVTLTPGQYGGRVGLRIEDVGPLHRLSWFALRLEGKAPSFHGQVVLPRRGRYWWGRLWASSGYPFGLVYRCKALVCGPEVTVLPRTGKLHRGRFRRLLLGRAFEQDRLRRQPRRHPAAQDQFHGLRPFRSGDSPRTIHWRTSAHRGKWMVREFEDVPGDTLVLIFDPVPAPEPKVFEEAVSLAATIAVEWPRDKGDRLLAVVAGAVPVILEGGAGAHHAHRVLEGLALVEPRTEPPTASPTDGELLRRLHDLPGAAVVVVSAGRSRLADVLEQSLHRPVIRLGGAADVREFYTPPEPVVAKP